MSADSPTEPGRARSAGTALAHAALAAALDGATGLLGAARVAVILRDASGLRPVARRGWSEEDVRALAAALMASADGGADVASMATAGADALPEPLVTWAAERGERALAVAPLSGPDGSLGALVAAFEPPARMTSDRLRSVELFAAPVALALAGARRGRE